MRAGTESRARTMPPEKVGKFRTMPPERVGKFGTLPPERAGKFIINLQLERAKICLAVFLDKKTGKQTDLTNEFNATDVSLMAIEWRQFGKNFPGLMNIFKKKKKL